LIEWTSDHRYRRLEVGLVIADEYLAITDFTEE
jgi:hypothetical protein